MHERPPYLVSKIARVAALVGVDPPEWTGDANGQDVLHALRRQIPERFRKPRESCPVERLLGVRRSGFGAKSQEWLLRADPCCYCGGVLEKAWIEVDHIHARAQGGDDHWTNYTAACRSCNAAKLDGSPLEWLARLRLLEEGRLSEALALRIGTVNPTPVRAEDAKPQTTVPAPEPCGWHPTGAWRFLRLAHEED